MKKILLTVALVASTAGFAQESKKTFKNVKVNGEKTMTSASAPTTSTAEAQKVEPAKSIVHQGLRVAVKKGNYDGEIEMKYLWLTAKEDLDVKDKIGLSVGYELLNLNNIGFIADLTYRKFELSPKGEPSEDINSYVLSGSASLAVNEMFYGMGGLALTYAKLPNHTDKSDPSINLEHHAKLGGGAQLGVGFKPMPSLALELSYNYLVFAGEYKVSYGTVETDLITKGFELALVGTF